MQELTPGEFCNVSNCLLMDRRPHLLVSSQPLLWANGDDICAVPDQ